MFQRIAYVFLLVTLITVACSPSISSTATSPVNDHPPFESTGCWGTIPSGVEAACGYVLVPENRAKPPGEDDTVHLAVMVLRAVGVQYTQPPTFVLGGGPGGDLIGVFMQFFASYRSIQERGFPAEQYPGHLQEMEQFQAVMDLFMADLQKREMVLLDQRGTGYSQPSLKCHGEDWDVCRQRLVSSGIDIVAYNTLENVEDVNDIRLALGYEQINLQGGSYGTRLALELMRRYPRVARAVVLDGVAPPQVDWAVEMVARYDDALDVLFDHCKTDAGCNAAYPELKTVFYDLIEKLNNQPMEVQVGEEVVILNGNDLRDTVWNALYDSNKIRFLPMLIYQVKNGQSDTWGKVLAWMTPAQSEETIAWGVHFSTECAERWAFETRADLVRASEGLPPAIRDEVVGYFASTFWTCETWDVPVAPSYVHTPVSSDTPTLLLSGEFDPATQPVFAGITAETLSHHYSVIFPYLGHTDGFTSFCHALVLSAFLDDPGHAPDTTCVIEMDKSPFFVE